MRKKSSRKRYETGDLEHLISPDLRAELDAQMDAMCERMETPEGRAAAASIGTASTEELGKAAVAGWRARHGAGEK